LIDIDGTVVLTDPWFSEKPTYHRGEPLACEAGSLPHLAGVFVSHDHYDHFDLAGFAGYPDKQVPFVVLRGLAGKVRAAGFPNVIELEPWQSAALGPLTITATPARHKVPEITAVLQGAGRTVFFGADTMRIPELDEVAVPFPAIDLALLPINGLRIRPLLNKQVVMDAEEAAALAARLSPAIAVPIHYAFTGGPIADRLLVKHDGRTDRFVSAVRKVAPNTQARVLAPGEPLRF
jgi:L-ascorbate metabolism protein UlaG (beta-lactamase superfamily)